MVDLWAPTDGTPRRIDVIRIEPRANSVPLGTIALATDRPFIAAFVELRDALARWPWMVPCISLALDERHLADVARLTFRHGERLAICTSASERTPTPRDLLNAVLARPKPSAETLARFVATRIAGLNLEDALHEQFSLAIGEIPPHTTSRATASRRFSAAGLLRAQDWRAVARLVHELGENSRSAAHGGRAAEARSILSPAGHRARRKYLGLAIEALERLIGWEAVLEHVLRRHGYVELAGERERQREKN